MITNSKTKAILYDWKHNHKRSYKFIAFLFLAFLFCGVYYVLADNYFSSSGTSIFGSNVTVTDRMVVGSGSLEGTYLYVNDEELDIGTNWDNTETKIAFVGADTQADLVCDALKMALWQRKPKPGLIVHSDRGSQYACNKYRKLLNDWKCIGSMSRKGDCWDNAVAESFFGSLKQERVQWQHYQTRAEAHRDDQGAQDQGL